MSKSCPDPECRGLLVRSLDPSVDLWDCEECDQVYTAMLVERIDEDPPHDFVQSPNPYDNTGFQMNGLRSLIRTTDHADPNHAFWTQTPRNAGRAAFHTLPYPRNYEETELPTAEGSTRFRQHVQRIREQIGL